MPLDSNSSMILFGYINFQLKNFLILYPSLENSTTSISIIDYSPCRFHYQHPLKVALSQKIMEKNFHCQHKYSKSLSWAENLNFPPKTVNNLFKFSAQDSDLEYLYWQWKHSPVSSDLKPPSARSDLNQIPNLHILIRISS